ncbi:hypothetical protein [Cesiribacter andamanensis]|uniref:GyrI-like small molecule binding domain-containing protein n=1 Tax=Cesiribacter andamanensis AMV16 TaxID=1279009 RepID=M7N4M7_9BACT|nr:hypothetical protein [Cesiribacter andamanensis]EMR02242.1 hypothetical protein ADICEAN_02637 [Cesiribacter andamanensis AMV16]
MSFPKILLIVVSLVVAAAAVAYWQLGGWQEASVQTIAPEGGAYRMVGKPYTGTPGHPEMEKIFRDVRKRWEGGELPGMMAIAVFREPLTNKDTLEQFMGVLLPPNFTPSPLPEGYELLQIPARQSVQARLEAHSSVWPSPRTLREKIEGYAQQQGHQLRQDVTLEKYVSPRRLEVEVPIR